MHLLVMTHKVKIKNGGDSDTTISKKILGILSIQNFSLSDPSISFWDELCDGILQLPIKNDNGVLDKMQMICGK